MLTSTAPATASTPYSGLVIRRVSRTQHMRFILDRSSKEQPGAVSFLQCPSWADVKADDWWPEFLGWFDGADQIGSALVLCRRLNGTRRFFAYLPEGPMLKWTRGDVDHQLGLLLESLRAKGAFAVRIGPPLEYRRWSAATLKQAVGAGRHVAHIEADETDSLAVNIAVRLRLAGWRRCGDDVPSGDAQPRYLFTVPLAGRDADDVWAGLSQAWRRHVRRAQREDVVVAEGGEHHLPTLYHLLEQTEQRNGFRLGRSLAYFRRQYTAMNEETPGRMKLYIAQHRGDVLAAHTMVSLGRRAWYLTGASASTRRQTRPSHALQWRLIRDAHALGAATYDMRGVPGTLDPNEDAFGLMRWKLGTGGDVVETLGEWEINLPGTANRMLHWAMRRYAARR